MDWAAEMGFSAAFEGEKKHGELSTKKTKIKEKERNAQMNE